MDPASVQSLSPDDRILFEQFGVGPSRHVEIEIVHHAFQMHARTQPDVIAVEHQVEGRKVTYCELDARANALATTLRSLDVSPGKRVLILARRSIELIVGILAVLKAGAAYIPLDAVTVTDSTLALVLQDATPTIALVMEDYLPRLGGFPALVLEKELPVLGFNLNGAGPSTSHVSSPPPDLSSPTDPIYVIYTSGTTGTPKGVVVRHNGVANVLSGPHSKVGMAPGLRVAQLLNIGFDMGAWEILGSLYNGCTLCLRGNSSRDWAALLRTVHIVISTPTILTRHDPTDYPSIRHVIVGGEPCPRDLADRWARYVDFSNCCGPTEISVMNTVHPAHDPGYPLSIGQPIPNTNVYILDPDTQLPVPIGEVGVMWVGGRGVSVGYLNLPDKTAERWNPDPFFPNANPQGLMFCTGDLARWKKDGGRLEHYGRADDQVKVKGFRVELDGVAAAMRSEGSCEGALALLIDDTLWGFVTPSTADLAAVRLDTSKVQPYYAVPSRFLGLENFPVTGNGKVDKRAVRRLATSETEGMHLDVGNKGVPFDASLPGTPGLLHSPTMHEYWGSPSSADASEPTTPSSVDVDVLADTPHAEKPTKIFEIPSVVIH